MEIQKGGLPTEVGSPLSIYRFIPGGIKLRR